MRIHLQNILKKGLTKEDIISIFFLKIEMIYSFHQMIRRTMHTF